MAEGIRSRAAAVRYTRGWTREEMARALKVHPVALARWECGMRRARWELMERWERLLGLKAGASKRIFPWYTDPRTGMEVRNG